MLVTLQCFTASIFNSVLELCCEVVVKVLLGGRHTHLLYQLHFTGELL